MSSPAKAFLDQWVLDHVENNPFAVQEQFNEHIKDLTTKLIVDASKAGVTYAELEEAAGDIGDYLQNAVEEVTDPELGFKD